MKKKITLVLAAIAATSVISGCGDHTLKTECDWCGKTETCKQYCVQSLSGYNRDGSFKYDYDYLYFSDSCYRKAKDKGGSYGWLNIIECD